VVVVALRHARIRRHLLSHLLVARGTPPLPPLPVLLPSPWASPAEEVPPALHTRGREYCQQQRLSFQPRIGFWLLGLPLLWSCVFPLSARC
jgi:hypothetical protein